MEKGIIDEFNKRFHKFEELVLQNSIALIELANVLNKINKQPVYQRIDRENRPHVAYEDCYF